MNTDKDNYLYVDGEICVKRKDTEVRFEPRTGKNVQYMVRGVSQCAVKKEAWHEQKSL